MCKIQRWRNLSQPIPLPDKGQLISKANFEVFIWTKKWTTIFLYFSKKRSNQKKGTLYHQLENFVLTLLHYLFDLTSFYRLGQKYKSIFVHFLAQMKSLKFAFKINWPLVAESKDANVIKVCNGTLEYSIYGKARVQNLSDIFAYELFFFSFWKIVFAKLVSDFLYKRSVNLKSIFCWNTIAPKNEQNIWQNSALWS